MNTTNNTSKLVILGLMTGILLLTMMYCPPNELMEGSSSFDMKCQLHDSIRDGKCQARPPEVVNSAQKYSQIFGNNADRPVACVLADVMLNSC